jgi:hypothetical protein
MGIDLTAGGWTPKTGKIKKMCETVKKLKLTEQDPTPSHDATPWLSGQLPSTQRAVEEDPGVTEAVAAEAAAAEAVAAETVAAEAVTGASGAATMAAGAAGSLAYNHTGLKAKNCNSLSVNVSINVCDFLKGR